MKFVLVPTIQCTSVEYKAEIEPIIKTLEDLNFCPESNAKRSTTWNCDAFEFCANCPFSKANEKVREALKILKEIGVETK
jgi:hypothetical protein